MIGKKLSVKRMFFWLTAGMTLTMTAIILVAFFLTQNIVVLWVGMALIVCAILWMLFMVQLLGMRLSNFTSELCQILDDMMNRSQEPENVSDKETIFARIHHRLVRLYSEMRNKIIQAGADVVLTQLCTEEISLQAYALIRRYTEWKSERKEEVPVIVGKLEILPLQRTVEWEHKRIHVVKREFDFLYLLASTPGRVYTYSQIYQLVWQEYPHGDIANIIYCMVHRLKRKLKKVDVSAEHIIISVKEVGYCLRGYKES